MFIAYSNNLDDMSEEGRKYELSIASEDITKLSSKYSPSLIYELKKSFPSESDETLARFLIARNGDHLLAKELLREHVAWRSKNLPVLKETCLDEICRGKVYRYGTDKEGHPLAIFRPRLNDPNTRDMEEMSRMIIWWASVIMADMPAGLSKCTILVDRTDVKSPDIPFLRAFGSVFQNNFPERVYRIIVYPGGLVFTALWQVVQWLLDPVTRDKVRPVLTLAGVQEFIDDEYIPRIMGGECDYEFDSADLPSDPAASLENGAAPDPASVFGGGGSMEMAMAGEGSSASSNDGAEATK